MESIQELKKICEKKHTKGVSKPSPYAKYFIRKISIYLTWLFLHTNINANQVTVLQTISNLIGIGFIFSSNVLMTIAGIFFLQLGYLLDNVDGEVARYRKTFSVNGLYIDLVNHLVCIPGMYLGMGMRYYLQGHGFGFLILGIIGMVVKMSPSKRARWSTIEHMSKKWKTPAYNFKYLKKKHQESIKVGSRKQGARGIRRFVDWFKGLLSGFPSCMNLYSLMLIAEIVWGSNVIPWLLSLFVFIGLMEIVWESYSFYNSVRNNRTEKAFIQLIESIKRSGATEA